MEQSRESECQPPGSWKSLLPLRPSQCSYPGLPLLSQPLLASLLSLSIWHLVALDLELKGAWKTMEGYLSSLWGLSCFGLSRPALVVPVPGLPQQHPSFTYFTAHDLIAVTLQTPPPVRKWAQAEALGENRHFLTGVLLCLDKLCYYSRNL